MVSLLIASFAQPYFAEQSISSGCEARNPNNGAVIKRMWYILYKGFCSNSDGDTSGDNFCIPWSDYSSWDNVDAAIRDESDLSVNMANEARYSWPSVQVLLPLAFSFAVVALALLLGGAAKDDTSRGSSSNVLFVSFSSTAMIICWVCAVSALNTALYSSTMSG